MAGWRIRQEGTSVLVFDVETGRTLMHAPWNQALIVAQELYKAAKASEEIAKHEQIEYDNAILLKTGVRFGLTNNARILGESIKTALYDRGLRKYMGPGIKSQEAFGTPTILQPEVNNGNSGSIGSKEN